MVGQNAQRSMQAQRATVNTVLISLGSTLQASGLSVNINSARCRIRPCPQLLRLTVDHVQLKVEHQLQHSRDNCL